MPVKITIKENTKTAKAFKEFMAEKESFRKAAEAGKAIEHASKHPERFTAALPNPVPEG